MKKYVIGFALLIIVSCSKDDAPRIVAEKFLNAMQTKNFAEASQFGTKETVKLLKQLERIEKLNVTDLVDKPGKIHIVSEDIQGSSAIVYFTEEGNELQQKITLKRVPIEVGSSKTEWKVDLKKEEMPIKKQSEIINTNKPFPAKISV